MSGYEHLPTPTGAESMRLDEDDHDLLTFGEAGERLRIEIARATAHVAEMAESGSHGGLEKATVRLRALRAAAKRNASQPINDANFEEFFGYAGSPRRNLPGLPPGM